MGKVLKIGILSRDIGDILDAEGWTPCGTPWTPQMVVLRGRRHWLCDEKRLWIFVNFSPEHGCNEKPVQTRGSGTTFNISNDGSRPSGCVLRLLPRLLSPFELGMTGGIIDFEITMRRPSDIIIIIITIASPALLLMPVGLVSTLVVFSI